MICYLRPAIVVRASDIICTVHICMGGHKEEGAHRSEGENSLERNFNIARAVWLALIDLKVLSMFMVDKIHEMPDKKKIIIK